jgi:hypothetical protein
MKKLIIFATCAALAGSALAQGDNFSAPTVQWRALPPVNAAQSEGSVQRGFRLGNPLQLLNPFAPVEYGSSQGFLTPREEEAGRRRDRSGPSPVALRLFSFAF